MPDRTDRRIGRRGWLRGAAALAAGAPFASAPFATLRAEEPPIRVGFPVPVTGPYATEAADHVRAAQLAIAEFNESGGMGGRRAELLVRDDKLDPGEAATRAIELIEKDRVDFIVGSLSASVQLAVNTVTKQRGILYNSISQSDQIVSSPDWGPTSFHEAMTPHMTATAVGRYAFGKFGKRIAYVAADYAYGHEMVAGFRAVGAGIGAEELAEIKMPIGTRDFSPLMPRLEALRPDILFLCNFGRDQQVFVKQAQESGLKRMTHIVAPILLQTARIAGGAQAFEGVLGGTSYYWGIERDVASAKAFNDRFRKAYDGRLPSDYGALGYSGVRSVLSAAVKAGSTATEKVASALAGMKYDFYKGPQYYRACDHQSVQSVFIIESKANGRVPEDVFNVLETVPGQEDLLKTCAQEGLG